MNRTLTYKRPVDPRPGTVMGPSLDGRMWRVLGTTKVDKKYEVELEEVVLSDE